MEEYNYVNEAIARITTEALEKTVENRSYFKE